jgi:hypothetical protein
MLHRHAAAIAVDCIPPTLPLPFPILPPLFLHAYHPGMEAASSFLGNSRIYCYNKHGGRSTTIIRCKQLTIVHAMTYLHRSLPIYLFINVSMNLSTAILFSDGGLSPVATGPALLPIQQQAIKKKTGPIPS